MKNLFNLTLMVVSTLCMIGVLTGLTPYDTSDSVGDRLLVCALWLVVALEYLTSYLKNRKQ